jgi:putative Holliday junction resolvase
MANESGETYCAGQIFEDAEEFRALLPDGRALVGIDAGTKTFGLALSDLSRTIASPLETIQRSKFSKDLLRFEKLIEENALCGLVLGLPRNLDGSEGPRVQSTRALARNFGRTLELPILLWDERLTTSQAERMLIEADTSRKRRGEVIDKLAATLILQGALDRLKC